MIKEGSIILFQGDSITDAGRRREDGTGGANEFGTGYVYHISGILGLDYPEKKYILKNRGISGNRSVDVYARWKKDAINLKPDVLSILMGVNDIGFEIYENSGISAQRYELFYRMMLEEAKASQPDLTIFLCEPFILPVDKIKVDWEKWDPDMKERQQIVENLAKEFGAYHIPLQRLFNQASSINGPEYWLCDGIHPTSAGHQLIAREWVKTFVENA